MFEAHCDDDEFFGWVAEDGTVIDENTRVEKKPDADGALAQRG